MKTKISGFEGQPFQSIIVTRARRKLMESVPLAEPPIMRYCAHCDIELAMHPRLLRCELCNNILED